MMSDFHVTVGNKVTFSKTVAESDVYLFAGVTGDFSRNHVDEEYMKRSVYGQRIAHGALLVGFMSTASTLIIDTVATHDTSETPVSLGYDRIRFLKPVYMHDTITVHYVIEEIDLERRRSRAKIDLVNQHGHTVAVAEHILKWVANT
jgi:3-hydroxybutyryl-CoA dehydratase